MVTGTRVRPPLRRTIIERDGGACLGCGSTEDLTVDHVVPYGAPGFSEDNANLRTLCRPCNTRKGGPTGRGPAEVYHPPVPGDPVEFAATVAEAQQAGARAHEASQALTAALNERDALIARAWAARPTGMTWRQLVVLYGQGVPEGAQVGYSLLRKAERNHRVVGHPTVEEVPGG